MDFNQTSKYVVAVDKLNVRQHPYHDFQVYPIESVIRTINENTEVEAYTYIALYNPYSGYVWRRLVSDKEEWVISEHPASSTKFLMQLDNSEF